MTKRQQQYQYRFGGPLNLIIALLGLALVFYLFSMLMRLAWTLALWMMPVLLIATFVMNRGIIINYLRGIGKLYKRNKTMGLVAGGLSVIGSPLVTLFLFGQAMLMRRVKQSQDKQQQAKNSKFGEYIEYEELDSSFNNLLRENPRRKEPKPRIEIRETPKEQPKKDDNPYDSLWE